MSEFILLYTNHFDRLANLVLRTGVGDSYSSWFLSHLLSNFSRYHLEDERTLYRNVSSLPLTSEKFIEKGFLSCDFGYSENSVWREKNEILMVISLSSPTLFCIPILGNENLTHYPLVENEIILPPSTQLEVIERKENIIYFKHILPQTLSVNYILSSKIEEKIERMLERIRKWWSEGYSYLYLKSKSFGVIFSEENVMLVEEFLLATFSSNENRKMFLGLLFSYFFHLHYNFTISSLEKEENYELIEMFSKNDEGSEMNLPVPGTSLYFSSLE